jgi:predicted dehydrogenase
MTTNRRNFLALAGASAAAAAAPLQERQNEKPIRLAIIGTGNRSLGHLASIKAIPGYQIVALADPTPANLDRAATLAPGAATYSDYKKLLAERKDIDAVVVITPSFLHADITVAVFAHGYPVLCEKPMATTVQDANRMIEASRKAGKPLYIGFQKRLTGVTYKMHELVAAGEIGKLEFVSANLFRGDWNPKSWKYTDPKTGVATNWRYLTLTEGSALLEDGIHEIDALNWMINSPVVRVSAAGGNNVFKDRETVDHVAAIFEYESGVKLSFELCLFTPRGGPMARRMVLIGSEGVMYPEGGRVAINKRDSKDVRYVETAEHAPEAARADKQTYQQYLLFAQTVRQGKPPLVDPQAAKNVVKMILLAENSMRQHRMMSWNDLPA